MVDNLKAHVSQVRSRIAIGTAQFGLPYGIANYSGQISQQEAENILCVAAEAGIDTLDTAIAYGSSEQVLGTAGVCNWRVITKLPAIPDDCRKPRTWIRNSLQASFVRMNLERVAGLLLHQPMQLLGDMGPSIYGALIDLKRQGLVEKIGYSLYSPVELDALWTLYPPDLIQAPYNVFDRRLLMSGWLAKLQRAGTEIHVRSIFLQGLLLMRPDCRPTKFRLWSNCWRAWDEWLAEQHLTPLQACLSLVFAQPEFGRIVIGIDSAAQLREVLAAAEIQSPLPPVSLATEDERLINPSFWNRL